MDNIQNLQQEAQSRFKEQGGIRSQYDPHMRYCEEE